MIKSNNRFRADSREFRFLLFEQLRLGELLGKAPFSSWGREEVELVLAEIERFATEVTGPLNAVGDSHGCRLDAGQVVTPPGFKEAWLKLNEAGWNRIGIAEEHGGQGAPRMLSILVEEMLYGSNASLSMYSGLTIGAAEVVAAFGTETQKQRYLARMLDGKWGGTMCLTEPNAGSDVGSVSTSARRLPGGTYSIRGTKSFISVGDHDLVDNIVHLVLARVEGAPAGTKGLSLFVVPKLRIGIDGQVGEPNDVTVTALEHKMGIHGSSTCMLAFGENDGCVGELVGTSENAGMSQMFRLMNNARIGVAIQGLGVASSAYLNALQYARERKQGPSFSRFRDPQAPRVAIIEHPDVRRMLIDMKARVEGIRALVYRLAAHQDRAASCAGVDEGKARYHSGQVELFVPIAKSYSSDQAFRVCETAIQVLGGVGYTRDYPVEQCCRDSKVFSIYEGTNHIQAMDLVGRKLPQEGSKSFRDLLADISAFVATNAGHQELGKDVQALGKASEALGGAAMQLFTWSQSGKMALVPLAANRFLEMMAETTVGWLLLDAARIAGEAAAALAEDHPDRAFYAGKKHAACYFVRNVLPGVVAKAKALQSEDSSALDIPDGGFATV
ncbi:MAG: acyl-CoA dehydrogenase [Pseudomonadota bacterium]